MRRQLTDKQQWIKSPCEESLGLPKPESLKPVHSCSQKVPDKLQPALTHCPQSLPSGTCYNHSPLGHNNSSTDCSRPPMCPKVPLAVSSPNINHCTLNTHPWALVTHPWVSEAVQHLQRVLIAQCSCQEARAILARFPLDILQTRSSTYLLGDQSINANL